ncbi:uncharacterized protein LOC127812428 [Diospyros lotus]|uniref:uncharacterized protein LOC127812428 n=1 Tax=Diospyros lotus TaxID=55363 RepID=UPI00225143CB|nr:uncharacterized protein LOC127812428 [Diospyros lotus]
MAQMLSEKSDSSVQEALKTLCCSNGWSYGVFWRFDRPNSLLLTMGDAYYDDKMGAAIDNMLLQVHILGNGVVGQAAFTRKDRWMFADAHSGGPKPAGSFESPDIFQDDSEIDRLFSSGIQTIALVSVEPRGVVQFGSTQKIPERVEFVDRTKRLFLDIDNHRMDTDTDNNNTPSSSNNEVYGQGGVFASLISSGDSCFDTLKLMNGATSKSCLGPSSSTYPQLLPAFTSIPGCMNSYLLQDQLRMAGIESPFKLSSKPTAWLQEPLEQSATSNRPSGPTGSSRSFGNSLLTSFEQQLTSSDTTLTGSQNMHSAKPNGLTSCSNAIQNIQGSTFPLVHEIGVDRIENRSTNQRAFMESPQAGDLTRVLQKSGPVDDYLRWIVPLPEQSDNTLATLLNENLSQGMELSSVSSGLNGPAVPANTPVKHSANSMQSSITNTINSEGNRAFLNDSNIENDFFDGMGIDFECGQAEDFLADILMPIVSGGHLDFGTVASECIPKEHIGSQETLFSKLGIEQFFDSTASSCNSIGSSCFEDELSLACKRRIGNCSVSGDPVELKSIPSFGENMNSPQPVHNLELKKKVVLQSEVGSRSADSYSITGGSSVVSQPKRSGEGPKGARKRARPGSRPKPKDRVQIQERIAELRKLIPNGVKMSIDSLLAQTIKHMLFLQSVTKHAEQLKQAKEQKGNEVVPGDDSCNGVLNALRASEVGARTMMDPVDVKDLSLPGQKLIQIICEEKGFFLEIVDVIQGLGLTILKGMMEIQDNKIWACFVVEAEANRRVTKQEISISLYQLLYQKSTGEINLPGELANVLNVGTMVFNNYHQPVVSLPISLAEGLM